ncbi:MAG: hypothetical protein ACJ75J_11405 [Cytophagaceae bacterium]
MSIIRKNFISSLLFVFISLHATAQKNVGIGTVTPNSKAALEVVSPGNDQGILIPRMKAVQRLAIPVAAADNSLMVYDIDSAGYMYWNGSAWKLLLATTSAVAANNGLTKTGSTIGLGGTLTSSTSIGLGGNNLTFTGGKLGVGTTGSEIFEVRGVGSTGSTLSMRLTNSLANTLFTVADDGLVTVNNNLKTTNFQMTTSPTANYVLTSDASGNGSWKSPAPALTFYPNIPATSLATATSTPAKITDITPAFTKNNAGSYIEVIYTGHVSLGGGSNPTNFQVRIDGNPPLTGRSDAVVDFNAAGKYERVTIYAIFQGLPAGSHTISIWAMSPTGANTVVVNPGNWSDQIIVKEVNN